MGTNVTTLHWHIVDDDQVQISKLSIQINNWCATNLDICDQIVLDFHFGFYYKKALSALTIPASQYDSQPQAPIHRSLGEIFIGEICYGPG